MYHVEDFSCVYCTLRDEYTNADGLETPRTLVTASVCFGETSVRTGQNNKYKILTSFLSGDTGNFSPKRSYSNQEGKKDF